MTAVDVVVDPEVLWGGLTFCRCDFALFGDGLLILHLACQHLHLRLPYSSHSVGGVDR